MRIKGEVNVLKIKNKFVSVFAVMFVLALVSLSQLAHSDTLLMKVYKTETCGCCNDWIEHVQAAGFIVESINLTQLQAKKNELGVPTNLASCHTAVIDGYVIEGHVPATDILNLLNEKPPVSGLAVPGMPHGSPGMETGRVDSFDVFTFEKGTTNTRVWASYTK